MTTCADCSIETLPADPGQAAEYYMVHDHVWEAAVGVRVRLRTARSVSAAGGFFLCIGCLEARLGRQLHRGDFTGALLNDLSYSRPDKAWWHRSDRLIDRLTAPSPADDTQLALWD